MASSSPGFAPFDVVIVPFPYTDRLAQKRRPALVMSAKALDNDHGLSWLIMITSAVNTRWAGDVEIDDLIRTGLPAPSLIRTAKIATVETIHILKRAGSLAPVERKAVLRQLDRYSARL